MADVTLQIAADITKGLSSIEKFRGDTQKSLSSIERSFQGLKTVAAAAVGIFAGQQIIKGINATIAAASRQQDAVNSLNTALRLSGEFSDQASEDLQKFASALQATSTVGDEAVLESLALAKAFGATNEQAKLVTQAAVELSAATGKSLEEATRQVSKTMGGFAGELGEVNPAIKALTAEQLRAGEAANILISQFGGSAQAQLQTFSGATKQLSNTYGDLLEAFGNIIVNNPALIAAIGTLQNVLAETISVVAANSDGISELLGLFASAASSSIPALAASFQFLFFTANEFAKGLSSIPFIFETSINLLLIGLEQIKKGFVSSLNFILKSTQSVGKLIGVSLDFSDSISSNNSSLDKSNDLISIYTKNIADIKDPFEPTIKQAPKAIKGLENVNKSTKDLTASQKELQAQAQKTLSEVDKIAGENEQLRLSIQKIGKTTEQVADIDLAYQKAKIDQQLASIDLSNEENKKLAEQLQIKKDLLQQQRDAKPSGGISGLPVNQDGAVVTQQAPQNRIGNETVGIIKGAFGEGASTLASKLGAFANPVLAVGEAIKGVVGLADSLVNLVPDLLRSLGGLVKSITNLPIELLNSFSEFLDSITDFASSFLQNLVRAVPGIITKAFSFLLRDLPKALTNTFRELPKLIKDVLADLPDIILNLINELPAILPDLIQAIIEATPDIALALVDSLITKGGIFRIAFALTRALVLDLPIALAQGFIRAIANIGGNVFKQLANIFSSGIKLPELKIPQIEIPTPGWLDRLQAIFDSFSPGSVFGDGGGFIGQVGGEIEGAVKALGFAEGGTVPSGFPNDTFPARLTSGEEVISKDRAERLDRFMAEAGGSKNITVNLQVGESELARVMFSLNQRGFRTA